MKIWIFLLLSIIIAGWGLGYFQPLQIFRRRERSSCSPQATPLLNRVKCEKILSMYYNISLSVVRSLPWSPCGLAGRRLPPMQKVFGSNPTEGKICFSYTLFRVECEELFWKTNTRLLKLIKIAPSYYIYSTVYPNSRLLRLCTTVYFKIS